MTVPHILYVATKAIIQNDHGEVLLLRQSDPTISGHNMYHPPGGILELGESLEGCLRREVREETGLEIEVVQLIDAGEWRAERAGNVMQFVGLYYLCRPKSLDLRLQNSEVSGAVWVGEANLEEVDILEPSKMIIVGVMRR